MKFLLKALAIIIALCIGYIAFVYFVTYSEGVRAGELVKFSKKGVIFKTWEGEISQGVSESQRFIFSVEDDQSDVIENLKNYQGRMVKLSYLERYGKLFWLGDTEYFITKVELNPTTNQ